MTLVGTTWSPVGPSPMSEGSIQDNGLVSAIAVHPTDANVVYQGTAGGGVWRTGDAGATWTPLFDRQISLGIGEPAALAVDPNDTDVIYVGTSSRVTPQTQAGLFKSTDGGASCVRLGSGYPVGNTGNASQFTGQWVNVIIVDPADSQTLYLSSTSGVFRSTDGGLNWRRATGATADTRSLVLDTSSPPGARILYAGVNGVGVVRSTDGARTFTQVLTGATPAVAAAVGAAPNGFRKVVVDLAPPASPPNPGGVQVLYATLEGIGGAADPVGLFLSTDAGATWSQRAATGMPTRTQGGYSFHMAVDPASPGDGVGDIIYFGTVGQARSTDAGASFTGLSGLHADTHSWGFFRRPAPQGSIVYCGNDGGIFRSTDDGATWTPINAGGLQTGLFYNIDVRPDATASATVGALQDNEIETTHGGTGLGWLGTNGGDGWDVAYDGTIAGQLYATSGFWSPAPCTRLFRSTDDGSTWSEITPWGTTSDAGCYLAPVTTDPSTGGIVYVCGSQNLWQSQDGGASWRTITPVASAGNVDVARADGNNVVIALGNRVLVSADALAATVGPPNGVTFTDITRNLPSRPVLRAVFDPVDPTVVYAVLGGFDGAGPGQRGHVFRTTIGGSAWKDISPALDVPFGAIALDGAHEPTTIYAGSDLGVLRSVDLGGTWTVLDDLHFPRAPVTDLVLRPESRILRAATYGRGVLELTTAKGPTIAVNLEDGLDFGTVCGGPQTLLLQVFNVGAQDLVIDSVGRLMGSAGVSVSATPGTPLVISAGEEVDFTVAFTPTTPGTPETATIRIVSNDPGAPVVDLTATGTGGTPALEVVVPGDGDMGQACLGTFAERDLVVDNRGPCALRITGLSSSSPEFTLPGVHAFPLVVGAGDAIALPVRFVPAALGARSGSVTIASDDPAGPKVIRLRGEAPAPRLALSIADAGSFGRVCVDAHRDEPLLLSNPGRCTLTVTAIASDSPEFEVPDVETFPLTIAPGTSVELPIRFAPTSFGAKSATIAVTSDDPAGVRTMAVSGVAPSGTIVLTGSPAFGTVELGDHVQHTIAVCNTGPCDLHVADAVLRCRCSCCDDDGHHHDHQRPCRHFRLVNSPFPATVRPGACLGVVVDFAPGCDGRSCCDLVVRSDDVDRPVAELCLTGSLKRTLSSALKCWAGQELRTMLQAVDDDCC
ncbi:MAG: hypothetical protein JWR63_4431 [Conexibacter sp.]|nr:hypothetical protein [Conexibacter sp.]